MCVRLFGYKHIKRNASVVPFSYSHANFTSQSCFLYFYRCSISSFILNKGKDARDAEPTVQIIRVVHILIAKRRGFYQYELRPSVKMVYSRILALLGLCRDKKCSQKHNFSTVVFWGRQLAIDKKKKFFCMWPLGAQNNVSGSLSRQKLSQKHHFSTVVFLGRQQASNLKKLCLSDHWVPEKTLLGLCRDKKWSPKRHFSTVVFWDRPLATNSKNWPNSPSSWSKKKYKKIVKTMLIWWPLGARESVVGSLSGQKMVSTIVFWGRRVYN